MILILYFCVALLIHKVYNPRKFSKVTHQYNHSNNKMIITIKVLKVKSFLSDIGYFTSLTRSLYRYNPSQMIIL